MDIIINKNINGIRIDFNISIILILEKSMRDIIKKTIIK